MGFIYHFTYRASTGQIITYDQMDVNFLAVDERAAAAALAATAAQAAAGQCPGTDGAISDTETGQGTTWSSQRIARETGLQPMSGAALLDLDFALGRYRYYAGIDTGMRSGDLGDVVDYDRDSATTTTGVDGIGDVAHSGVDEPAIVYTPRTLEARGLQVYPATENLAPYSEPGGGHWPVSDDSGDWADEPMGVAGLVLDRYTSSETSTQDHASADTVGVCSAWAFAEEGRTDTAPVIRYVLRDGGDVVARATVTLDYQMRAFGVEDGVGDYTVHAEDYGGGLYRVTVSLSTTEVVDTHRVALLGGSDAIVGGVQVTPGIDYVPVYVPTGATATTTADSVATVALEGRIGASQLTLYVDHSQQEESQISTRVVAAIESPGSGVDGTLVLYREPSGTHAAVLHDASGAVIASITGACQGAERLAVAVSSAEMRLSGGGETVAADVTGTLPPWGAAGAVLRLGAHRDASYGRGGVTISRVMLVNRALSDSALDAMTGV